MTEQKCFCGESMHYYTYPRRHMPVYECLNEKCIFCGNIIFEKDIAEFDRLVASIKTSDDQKKIEFAEMALPLLQETEKFLEGKQRYEQEVYHRRMRQVDILRLNNHTKVLSLYPKTDNNKMENQKRTMTTGEFARLERAENILRVIEWLIRTLDNSAIEDVLNYINGRWGDKPEVERG